jgi:hypothetical protein
MGTTLTGTTPQTTYDSLIKVTDNAPLTGSLKTLTDGLGNDSALALSTGAASVTGTLAVSNDLRVDTSVLVVDTANNRVGINKSTPFTALDVNGNTAITGTLNVSSDLLVDTNTLFVDATNNRVGVGTASPASKMHLVGGGVSTSISDVATTLSSRFDIANPAISLGIGYVAADIPMLQSFNNTTNTSLNLTINPFGGNVGIGTSSPAFPLHILSSTDIVQYESTTNGLYNQYKSTAGIFGYVGSGSQTVSGGGTTDFGIQAPLGSLIIATGGNTERLRIASNGNTTIKSDSSAGGGVLNLENTTTSVNGQNWGSVNFISNDSSSGASGIRASIVGTSTSFNGDGNIVLSTAPSNGTNTERMRITSAGNVGIGTSSPASKLDVNGDIATSGNILLSSAGGIYFDSGASKYLDDYEVGTWTPTVVGTGSGAATYTSQLGTYTKIGRQVVVQFFITFAKNTLSGGTLQIRSFPFTAEVGIYPQGAILFDNLATALTNPLVQMGGGTSSADLIQDNGSSGTHSGLNVDTYLGAGNMQLRGTITYFV